MDPHQIAKVSDTAVDPLASFATENLALKSNKFMIVSQPASPRLEFFVPSPVDPLPSPSPGRPRQRELSHVPVTRKLQRTEHHQGTRGCSLVSFLPGLTGQWMTMAHIIPYPQPACLLLLEPRWKLVPSPSWLRFMEDSVKIRGLAGTSSAHQDFIIFIGSYDSTKVWRPELRNKSNSSLYLSLHMSFSNNI